MLHWDVDCDARLQINHIRLEGVDLRLALLQLLQQSQAGAILLVDFALEVADVDVGGLEIVHDTRFFLIHLLILLQQLIYSLFQYL